MSVIKVDNISKDYGSKRGVFNLSFEVNRGEIFGMLGPNGAGKTTTIRQLMGFIKSDKGSAKILDMDCFVNRENIQLKLGYLPGEIAFMDEMKGSDFIRFIAEMKSIKSKKRINELTDLFELDANRKIKNMSKGTKQKIAIVCAFMNDPEVVILDEPTSGLDPNQLIEVRALIKSLGGTRTVILSTHILSEVEDTCERALIIDSGELIAEDTIEGLKMAMDREILGGNIELKVADRQNDALLCVREVNGVVQAETDNFGTIIIECERGNDSRAEIVKHLVNNNFDVLEIKPKERSLEEVFIYFTDKKKNQDFDKSKYIKDDSIKNNTEE